MIMPSKTIFLRGDLGIVEVSGVDALEFLQGQLTCDLQMIDSGESTLGAYCNPQGRMIATFRVLLLRDNYYVFYLPLGVLPAFLCQLKKYGRFSQVVIEDVSDHYYVVGMLGEIQSLAQSIFTVSLDPRHHEFILPKVEAWPEDNSQALNHWQLWEIESGIASVQAETVGQLTPHMLNYHQNGGVSFTKGCFMGQEVVARMQHLGTFKRPLCRAYLESTVVPQRGNELFVEPGKAVGKIIHVAKLPGNKGYALLVSLHIKALGSGQPIFLDAVCQGDALQQGEVSQVN